MVDFAGPQAHSVMLATRAARLASRPLLRSQGAYALPAAVSSVDRFAGVRWKKSKAGGDAGAEIESLEDVVDMDVVEERLQGAVEALKRDLSGLRAGRADASMLDHLEVSAYGSMQPLSAVAQVSVKGPALLVVNAFDPSTLNDLAAAVRDSEMGLGTKVDGNAVRVEVPKLTKETRAAMAKTTGKHSEKAKQHARRVRNDYVKKAKSAKGSVSDDDIYAAEQEIHKAYEKTVDSIVKMVERKKAEISDAS